jgi:hypothetical protein
MEQYEYLPVDIPADTAILTARLNVLGLEGWQPAFSDPINQRVVLWRLIKP